MQFVFLSLSTLLALYVSNFACASNAPQMPDKPVPHIALMLPIKSAVFGAAAEAVRQGFQAAAEKERANGLPVRVYNCLDESRDIATLYRQAIADGARAAVGPLTRSGVAVLAAQNISVPTLALNLGEFPSTGQLYYFGMAVESEARQMAQQARQQGLNRAIVISAGMQLDRRLQFAFEGEWQRLGGVVQREIDFDNDLAVFANISNSPGTAIFVAADAEKVRLIRPYLPNKLPVYATSQIFTGNSNTLANFDMNGIHFVDMPWLLQADHPAVMTYPHAAPPLSTEHERLYALGIDAFRLIQVLLAGKMTTSLPLDGVSGQIELKGNIFYRSGLPATIEQGQARLANTQDTQGKLPETHEQR